jgi:gamma-glutamyltranspeptidase/glutathione hydrolase
LKDGCVVSYCPIASAAGARILREGGNAIDAAVATSLALAVTFPQAGNLGGGGFLMYAPRDGEPTFLDYRETAPRALTAEMFHSGGVRDEMRSTRGALPVGVPGTVAGLAAALERYGTMSFSRVVAPSIELARRGTWLTTRQARYLELHADMFRTFPSSAKVFVPNGAAPLPGTLFVQPSLGDALERLATHGPRDFYEGGIARQIADTIRAHGGVLDEQDLASYAPIWRQPYTRRFLGRRMFAPSLPSGGGLVLMSSLGLFEAEGLASTAPLSADRYLAYGRVMRTAFLLRGALLGDPAFLSGDAAEAARRVAEASYAAGDLARLAKEHERAPSPRVGNEQNTTHLCVIDGAGNAVSNTYSLNTLFGGKLVVEGAGFLLNNSLDDFSLGEGVPNWYELSDGSGNHLEPGKRPVSSMSPAIFLHPEAGPDGHAAELVVGGSGGPRIPSLIMQIAQSTLGDDLSLEESVRTPRVHHQYRPDELAIEDAMHPEMKATLRARVGEIAEGVCAKVAETPVLGIASALRVGGSLSPGVNDPDNHFAQNENQAGPQTSPKASPLTRRPPLAAVLDSRFTLV